MKDLTLEELKTLKITILEDIASDRNNLRSAYEEIEAFEESINDLEEELKLVNREINRREDA